ncbi:MAG: hypothetical protein SOW48_01715 [Peptoniphilaceae bacterium]|nr:hypothetical protein [Peptoniphilaceae bacterium]MCI6660293.1 hypothetical protein [Peptoniphilaceae bacterium]MDD7434255.1 hypothetical protein [Peptoniphilaceae bacterium]MDY3075351.1 hypothetical protein [Peptoniphilaceae bacterium]MDY3987066.1 hypothetical protein [Peptoniphilaceae bacterium]
MKKHGFFYGIAVLLLGMYVSLTLLLTKERDAQFWLGFGAVIFALVVWTVSYTLSTDKKLIAPARAMVFSITTMYVLATWSANLILDGFLAVGRKLFFSVHILMFTVAAVSILVILKVAFSYQAQKEAEKRSLLPLQRAILAWEELREKVRRMPQARGAILHDVDLFLNDLRFADFGPDAEDSEQDLLEGAERFSAEVDHIESIASEDFSSAKAILEEMHGIVRIRSTRIRVSEDQD